jgi:hypothetical protein
LLVSVTAGVKAFFGYSTDKKDELAKFVEDRSSAHIKETFEYREEMDLDKAGGLNVGEDRMVQQNASRS